MSLANLINQHALSEATAGDFDAVAVILNAATIEHRTSSKIDFDTFIDTIGTETAEQVLAELSMTQIGESLRRRLELSGLDFSDASTIEQLDRIGARVTVLVLKKLKELGVRFVSPAGEVVTADQCRDAWHLGLKEVALDFVRSTAVEAAQEEYRKSGSTPASIIAAAKSALGA